MTVNDVYEHFGENWAHTMRELGMAHMSYRYWLRIGRIPRQTQYKIEGFTNGKLKVAKNVD
tara:strand:+ start:2469 stop:2651 length:183 start_codon:yes stop_codon:yes gene_type:complete